MASSTFRSATVEEYDEGLSDNDAHGAAPPHAEGNVTSVASLPQDYQPHLCESRVPAQSYPVQVQPASKYSPEARQAHHELASPHPHGHVGPLATQLPPAPTPPPNRAPKKSKRKGASSSRRRNKDRPEYYGLRGPSTSVVPAIPADPAPRSSNIRIARRPTNGLYVSGSPPGATRGPEPGDTADPSPRSHRPTGDYGRPYRNAPSANTFRTLDDTQMPGQHHPPQSHGGNNRGWEAGDQLTQGPGPAHLGDSAPSYPPPQQNNPGFIVISQGQGSPPNGPSSQSRGMEGGYGQPPPPQTPAPPNPHGVVVLTSNNSRPADAVDERPPPRSFYRLQPTDDQRGSWSPPSPRPLPQHDDRAAAHQIPGRQSVKPANSSSAQPRNSYGRARDYPSRDALSSPTSGPCPEFERLSLDDAPHRDRRIPKIPPHPSAGQFRSQDIPAPLSHPDGATSSHEPPIHSPGEGPQGRQRERYPSGNEPGYYTSHPQQRHIRDPHPPMHHQTPAETPAPTAHGDWPEPPTQWAPKAPHPRHDPNGFPSIPEESNRFPTSAGQVGYPGKPPRAGPPHGHYQPEDSYHRLEEDFAPDIPEPSTSLPHRHPEDSPTLPDGHPFLRMKDMALAAILKEFRAWQTSGMPGRRGPHGRRPPFSCPFAKKDPLRYKDCFSDALPSIPDVKEHISRCHAIPIYCPRCMDLFDDEKARDHHIRHTDCRPQQWSCPDGVTESQKRQLRTSVPTYLPPPDQWAHIFSIVFQQRIPTPESPYVDETLHEDVSTYRDFLETRGPRALSDVLTFRGAATWNLPNEERDLTAFRCLVLDEGIRDLVDQWARRNGGDSLRSPPSLASSSGAGPQRTPSMGSFASSEGHPRAHQPSSPVAAHHWDPRPRIQGEVWDEYGGSPAEHADFSDPRWQKAPMYAPRREQAPY